LIRAGCSKVLATFIVFIFSALMHEIVISFPFQHVYFYAFFGMLAQAPMIFITKYVDRILDNSFFGNAMFWFSFCIIGQPMGVIMYYYDLSTLSMLSTTTVATTAVTCDTVTAAVNATVCAAT
jgi:diacylglycerol O-acyltransferase 1